MINCEITRDRSRLDESDVVITHMRDNITDLPTKQRPINQRWIFFLKESPLYSSSFENFNGFYNLTATYRIGNYDCLFENKN